MLDRHEYLADHRFVVAPSTVPPKRLRTLLRASRNRVIQRPQLYDHEPLGLVIARSVDEAALRDVDAGEGAKSS